ncbi:hypothetical protein [Kitasatospora griseola]|uniref:hypothetical protein n=1 Tax=Kitasatospora griseola TaxID=2064 RepID=UPI0038229560
MAESDPDRDPDEHVRYARYQRAFAHAAPQDGTGLVARVLTDPDEAMASSAVREHLDRRAVELFADQQSEMTIRQDISAR